MCECQPFFRLLIVVILMIKEVEAQKVGQLKPLSKKSDWSVAHAHSHNDYQQIHPFTSAYQAQFGSMEADILLYHDSLFVGHSEKDSQDHKLFSNLYLDSLLFYCRMNMGYVFRDKTRTLQLLIDIKTAAEPTLEALIHELSLYPDLLRSPSVIFVITGNRPPPEKWASYPDYILFDGNAGTDYSENELKKIAMLSGNFASYASWKGTGIPDSTTIRRLTKISSQAHDQGKRIRFWNAPDNAEGWLFLISIGADWINTDHIDELSLFLLNL